MNTKSNLFLDIIKKKLQQKEFEHTQVIPIPRHANPMLRMQAFQTIIEDLDESKSKDTLEYFIQIKVKKNNLLQKKENHKEKISDNIFLPSGKLNIPFLIKNGDLLYETGEYALARNIYKEILRSGEYTGPTFFRIGRCYESEKKPLEAQVNYEESIAYHPTLEGYEYLGALLIAQEKDQEAAELFERALCLKELTNDIQFELYKTIGNCWTRANNTLNAEKHFKCALQIIPSADEIRSNLGSLALQNKKINEAKQYFRDAIASNATNHLALSGLGICAWIENDKVQAHHYFVQSLESEINNPQAIFYLVKCAYEIKSYATAARLLESYSLIAPINGNLIYSLAGLNFYLGKIENAKIAIIKLLKLEPEHLGAKELLKLIEIYDEDLKQ